MTPPEPSRSDPRAALVALVRDEIAATRTLGGRRAAMFALAGEQPADARDRDVVEAMAARRAECCEILVAAGAARDRRQGGRAADQLLAAARARALSPEPVPDNFADSAVALLLSRYPLGRHRDLA